MDVAAPAGMPPPGMPFHPSIVQADPPAATPRGRPLHDKTWNKQWSPLGGSACTMDGWNGVPGGGMPAGAATSMTQLQVLRPLVAVSTCVSALGTLTATPPGAAGGVGLGRGGEGERSSIGGVAQSRPKGRREKGSRVLQGEARSRTFSSTPSGSVSAVLQPISSLA